MDILPEIANALVKSFIKWEPVAEVLSLGYMMHKPVLLYGRGGHGKSEMVRSVFRALAETSDIFIQSCGEGMTEAKLFGGLSLKALNCPENPRMEFEPERSFLAKKFALLEEIFDAPPVVLLSLKDTLTDKCLNNGAQRFPMETKLLVAATNKNPSEISELGDSAHALTERFPLQLRVEWDSYQTGDFVEMFDKMPEKAQNVPPPVRKLLAGLIADVHEKGHWISPRQAVICLEVVSASALLANREAIEDDILAIKFVPGTSQALTGMHENLRRLKAVADATSKLNSLKEQVAQLEPGLLASSPVQILKSVKRLLTIEENIASLTVPDALFKERTRLGEKVSDLISSGKRRAIDCTIV